MKNKKRGKSEWQSGGGTLADIMGFGCIEANRPNVCTMFFSLGSQHFRVCVTNSGAACSFSSSSFSIKRF